MKWNNWVIFDFYVVYWWVKEKSLRFRDSDGEVLIFIWKLLLKFKRWWRYWGIKWVFWSWINKSELFDGKNYECNWLLNFYCFLYYWFLWFC